MILSIRTLFIVVRFNTQKPVQNICLQNDYLILILKGEGIGKLSYPCVVRPTSLIFIFVSFIDEIIVSVIYIFFGVPQYFM